MSNWLESKGYENKKIHVSDFVNIHLCENFSSEDIDEYKKEISSEISLDSLNLDKNDHIIEFIYECDHPLLKEYRTHFNEWMEEHEIKIDNKFNMSNNYTLFTPQKLSKNQIHDFEEEFEVKCVEKFISLVSNKKNRYEFKDNTIESKNN